MAWKPLTAATVASSYTPVVVSGSQASWCSRHLELAHLGRPWRPGRSTSVDRARAPGSADGVLDGVLGDVLGVAAVRSDGGVRARARAPGRLDAAAVRWSWWRSSDARAVRRAGDEAHDEHERQQDLDDSHRLLREVHAVGVREDAPVSILKTRDPSDLVAARRRGVTGPCTAGVQGSPYALGVARADLDKQPTDVRRMFDAVAQRYDVTNDVLSLGQDRRWRHEVIARRRARCPGERVLDLAAGTGTSSQPFADAGAEVVPCDFSLGMLQVGKEHRPHLPFTAGDGTRLPFADDTFDAVTISFGLRNIVDPDAGLREMLRVTRPGGRLVVCEFSHPTWAPFRTVYVEYLMKALPADRPGRDLEPGRLRLPRRVDPGLARPGRRWPTWSPSAGWQRPEWRNLSGGIVALHRATA